MVVVDAYTQPHSAVITETRPLSAAPSDSAGAAVWCTVNDVPDGEPGEILYRSPQLCDGYWDKPEATADAFSDGWFHSGDLVTREDVPR